ncbi:MAG: type II toxin-antitoxin system prevent-host-death family antitoxin [Candidatus Gracilibacteria bacterium]|jgi:prevent-host-death family protein
MYIVENTVSVSDLRKHTIDVMKGVARSSKPVVVFSRSKPKIVLISYQNYAANEESERPIHSGRGADFFINTPEKFLIHKKGCDAVKEIRKLRD